jgi:hypothetical protein
MSRFIFRSLVLMFVLLMMHDMHYSPAHAQQPGDQWMQQQRIPNLQVLAKPLILIADQNETVHVLVEQIIDYEQMIVYMSWSLAGGWTDPVDIILAPYKNSVQVLDVIMDENGMMHLLLNSGDELGAHLYYTNAPAAHASNAQAWQKPQLIGEETISPFSAALAAGQDGDLYVLYSGKREGNGMYAVYSDDWGKSWSLPDPLYFTYGEELRPFGAQLFPGETGYIHAVWNVVNGTGHGTSGLYAQIDTNTRRWSIPIELDSPVGLGILTPAVIEHNNNIFVTYYNGRSNSNWWRRSLDNGHSWSEPVRLSNSHQGTNGRVSFAVDSENTLHIFFGQRINELNHGMWHSTWQGNRWGPIEQVVAGPASSEPRMEFDPRGAGAVVSQGNTLLVTWNTDAQTKVLDVWYSYRVLNTPSLPIIPLPVPTLSVEPMPTLLPMAISPTPTPTPERVLFDQKTSIPPAESGSNAVDIIFLSTIPSLLISALAVILYRRRRRDL